MEYVPEPFAADFEPSLPVLLEFSRIFEPVRIEQTQEQGPVTQEYLVASGDDRFRPSTEVERNRDRPLEFVGFETAVRRNMTEIEETQQLVV